MFDPARRAKGPPSQLNTQNFLVTAFEADEVHDLQAGKTELLGNGFLEVVLDRELLRVLFGHEEFLIFENDFLEDLSHAAIDLALHEFRLGLLAGSFDLGLGDFLFLFDGFGRNGSVVQGDRSESSGLHGDVLGSLLEGGFVPDL